MKLPVILEPEPRARLSRMTGVVVACAANTHISPGVRLLAEVL